jgi:predicted NACHT family NTPase
MLVFCPKPELSLWHAKSCLESLCSNYQVDNLKICLKELISNQLVQWKSIGYEVVGKTSDGKDKKAQKLKYHESHPIVMLEYLKPHHKEFILHNYIT